jgi:hypothetical protein
MNFESTTKVQKDHAIVVKDTNVWSLNQSSNKLILTLSIDLQISPKICILQSLEKAWMIQV